MSVNIITDDNVAASSNWWVRLFAFDGSKQPNQTKFNLQAAMYTFMASPW